MNGVTYMQIDYEHIAWECSGCGCAMEVHEPSELRRLIRYCSGCGAEIIKAIEAPVPGEEPRG